MIIRRSIFLLILSSPSSLGNSMSITFVGSLYSASKNKATDIVDSGSSRGMARAKNNWKKGTSLEQTITMFNIRRRLSLWSFVKQEITKKLDLLFSRCKNDFLITQQLRARILFDERYLRNGKAGWLHREKERRVMTRSRTA